jgi:hypothetical protein
MALVIQAYVIQGCTGDLVTAPQKMASEIVLTGSPVIQHGLQGLLDGIPRSPAGVLQNLFRAAKDDLLI